MPDALVITVPQLTEVAFLNQWNNRVSIIDVENDLFADLSQC
jgi:DNA-binding beta-propeller fold protein YncE